MYLKSPSANLSVAWNQDMNVGPLVLHLHCVLCPSKFSSAQALALHSFKVHGVKHIRSRSKVCLKLRGPCLTTIEADELDAVEHGAQANLAWSGLWSLHASIHAVQLAGPLQSVFAFPGTASLHHALGRGHNFW